MATGILHMLQKLWEGQTVMRIMMDTELSCETVVGRTVDVGGGRNPDYFSFFKKADDFVLTPLDTSISGIDFEHDALPFDAASVDTVVACNILEHIYNYRFLVSEMFRILRPNGRIIGVVPFWVGYHPDPHDFFRYTHESLARILREAGFTDVIVRPFGGGPLLANFNTVVLSMPRPFRPLLYLVYAPLDRLFLILRPKSAVRHPLGYVCLGTKTTP